jgi:ABC-2 type transport system ATP-binding protein
MLSSHVLEEVERICDHVVALDAGRLVAQGTMAELAGTSAGVEVELVDIADRPGSIDDVERRLVAGGLIVKRTVFTLAVSGRTNDELFDAIAVAVAASDARIRSMGTRRRTLDDVFTDDVVAAGARAQGGRS